MMEENTMQIEKHYYDSLKLKQMRADICEVAMMLKDPKNLESCCNLLWGVYRKEVADLKHPTDIESMAEDVPNDLLLVILSLFKKEPEDTLLKRQIIKYFEEEVRVRREHGILPKSDH